MNDSNKKLIKLIKLIKTIKKSLKMGPGPRFEPESQDPQSRRMTAYPTPADKYHKDKNKKKDYAGAGIRTLVDLRQQVLSLSPLAARTPPL